MLYGSEKWTMNIHIKSVLLIETDYWRRAARKSRMERIRNNTDRNIMEVEDAVMEAIEPKLLI